MLHFASVAIIGKQIAEKNLTANFQYILFVWTYATSTQMHLKYLQTYFLMLSILVILKQNYHMQSKTSV